MNSGERMRPRKLSEFLLAGCAFAVAASAQSPNPSTGAVVDVKPTHLVSRTITDNWPSYNGDYTGRRFSSLTQITPQNVAHLQAQWVFHSRNAGILEVTPVVVNGVMYVTASNDAYALNAQTGQILWHYSRPISSGTAAR